MESAAKQAALDQLQKKIEQATGTAPAAPPASSEKKKPSGRRKLDEAALPEERVVIEEMEALVLRGEAEVVGTTDESTTLKYRRGSLVRLVTVQKTYRLEKDDQGNTTLITVEAPLTILPRSIGTPFLFAHIATEKFDRAMPRYRQEERFEQLGTTIERSVMSRWLEPIGATLGATIPRDADRSARDGDVPFD